MSMARVSAIRSIATISSMLHGTREAELERRSLGLHGGAEEDARMSSVHGMSDVDDSSGTSPVLRLPARIDGRSSGIDITKSEEVEAAMANYAGVVMDEEAAATPTV